MVYAVRIFTNTLLECVDLENRDSQLQSPQRAFLQGLIHKILAGGAKPRLWELWRVCAQLEPDGVYPPGVLSHPLGGLGGLPQEIFEIYPTNGAFWCPLRSILPSSWGTLRH